jgi:hypothetical protein
MTLNLLKGFRCLQSVRQTTAKRQAIIHFAPESFDCRRVFPSQTTAECHDEHGDEFSGRIRRPIKRMGPVENVHFSLADSFVARGEFFDSVLSDWRFSTGPDGLLRIVARFRYGSIDDVSHARTSSRDSL